MTAPLIALNNGTSIPQIGLGTWPLNDDEVEQAVIAAAGLGYRHVDTAAKYGNETGVGRGIRNCGVPREQMFVTTKLDGGYQGDDRAIAGLAASLERLGLDYVDLLLIHWPLPARGQFVSTWRTFERLLADGRARAIGTSNFKPAHLEVLAAETSIVPAVNQVQISPRIPRLDHREYAAAHGIVTESWSPLGGGDDGLRAAPELAQVGAQYGKTPGQVVLRWHVQNGLVAIPKSANPARMAENLDVFDFELSDADLLAIDRLSIGAEPGVDSDVDGH
jgi:Aldo/keto reductases, related to diketogulonate reductase